VHGEATGQFQLLFTDAASSGGERGNEWNTALDLEAPTLVLGHGGAMD
jgi:hypothetical protein